VVGKVYWHCSAATSAPARILETVADISKEIFSAAP
jgi:hypothetical protein